MVQFLQTYAFEVGLGVSLLGLLKLIYRYIVAKSQDPIKAEIIDIKIKTSTKGVSRKATYPIVEIVQDDGSFKKVYCYTAKKSGSSYYDNYQKMDMLVVRNIIGKVRYIPIIGYWLSSFNILFYGLIITISSFFI